MKQSYIGENIRIYRERANLTQQELADRLGISWEMISRYEREESSPLRNINRISEALKVSKTQLLEKHIPERYNLMEYKIPLFVHTPPLNRFISSQTNYYYSCPEWIIKKDRDCIAIDTSLIKSEYDEFRKGGVVYVSINIPPKKNDLVLIKGNGELITTKYINQDNKILGRVLAQEVRY